ncbi:MAG: hypothetical protein DCF15_21785 [Phormidesmis priestleyi]|uniref:Uncharacterized protein n=1 Tax=Phormidesmis priestleyi TaxID=268141 RepID=A0A2W4WK71_9CYAN|nr:MAG: hypothetical protein DCF15_21785 [Phormidesmis priestleyi]
MTPDHLDEIKQLRARKVAPKQIARKLGLRPAEVQSAIQQQAAAERQVQIDKGDLLPLAVCLANGDMLNALKVNAPGAKAGLLRMFSPKSEGQAVSGLGSVMIARRDRGRFLTSIFLVDYFCLGVKDVVHRKISGDDKLRLLQEASFGLFDEAPEEISLQQAQSIVFGAVDYAHSLGFEPHRDFEKAKANLGDRPDSLLPLEFGRDGQPFYFQGPHDNPAKIIATLNQSVGEGNYDWLGAM